MSGSKVKIIVAVLAVTLAALANGTPAESAATNFKLTGTAKLASLNAAFTPGGTTFQGTANVTKPKLGSVTHSGTLHLNSPNANGVATGNGTVTITFSNADVLHASFNGQVNTHTGAASGTATFTGGTGQFAGASGTGSFSATINVKVPVNSPMTVTITGTLH